MDYTGKKVFHKIYGPGSILRQDDKGYIYVQFDKCPDSKKFSAPMCFQNFLKLEDKSLEEAAQEEGRKKELEREEERQKRARQANQAKGMENPPSRRGRKSTPSSTWPGCAFSSVSDFLRSRRAF